MQQHIRLIIASVLLSLCLWPAVVLGGLIVSYILAEGSVVNTWLMEPRRNLITAFTKGLIASAPWALAAAFLALYSQQLLKRFRYLRWIVYGFFPAAGIGVAYFYYHNNSVFIASFLIASLFLIIAQWLISRFIT